MDALILDFLKDNGLTVLFAYTLLYGLATYSPWAWDERVMEILGGAMDVFRFRKASVEDVQIEEPAPPAAQEPDDTPQVE